MAQLGQYSKTWSMFSQSSYSWHEMDTLWKKKWPHGVVSATVEACGGTQGCQVKHWGVSGGCQGTPPGEGDIWVGSWVVSS